MRGRVNRLGLVMLLIVLLLGTAQGHHDDDRPHTLLRGSWVCVSQAAYGQAAAGQRAGKDVQALRKELRNENDEDLCIYVDDEILEDMMAPWVRVLGQEGDQIDLGLQLPILFLRWSYFVGQSEGKAKVDSDWFLRALGSFRSVLS